MKKSELKPSGQLIIYTVFLFVILPLANLQITQDPELSLRFLLHSVFTAFFLLLLVFKWNSDDSTGSPNPVSLAFLVYFLIALSTLSKSINAGDGVYEAGKTGLWLFTIIILPILLKPSAQSTGFLAKMITVSALVFICISSIQFANLKMMSAPLFPPVFTGSFMSSTLSNKNFFAETLLLMLPFSCFLIITFKGILRVIAVLCLMVSIYFIIILQSAAVYAAFAVSAIVTSGLLFRFRKFYFPESLFKNIIRNRVLLTVSVVALCTASAIAIVLLSENRNTIAFTKKVTALKFYIQHPDDIFDSSLGQNNNSLYDRIFLAKNSIRIAAENPLTGSGMANWEILLPKYGLYGNHFMSIGRVRFEHPHNDYLFVLCETGILGLFAWLSVFALAIWGAIKVIRTNRDKNINWLMMLMISGLISFCILSLFSYPKERFFSMLLLICMLSVIIVHAHWKFMKPAFPLKIILIVVLIMCIAISWINYQRYRSEIMLYTAFLYQKKENFRQMQRFVEKAISPFHVLDITGTPVSWHLGQAMYYQGNHEQAFQNYFQASTENPYHMQVLNDLGALYESKGDHNNAIACFNRVFAINPDFPDSRWNMVAVHFNKGEVDTAFKLMLLFDHRFNNKWRTQMNTILIAKTEKLVQATHDTLLTDHLNEILKTRQFYLIDQLFIAEKQGISFEKQLLKIR